MGFLSDLIGIGTSFFGADAAEKAANKQIKSNRRTLDRQIEQVAPFREAGVEATGALRTATGLGTPEESQAAVARFQASPEYTLNYDNMLQDARGDVEAYGSGTGNLFSGNTLKALQDRAGRLSNQLFGNYTNNLFKLSTQGANAATGNASNMGAAEGRNQTAFANQGNANVAGILGIGQGLQGMFDGDEFANMFGGGPSSFGG